MKARSIWHTVAVVICVMQMNAARAQPSSDAYSQDAAVLAAIVQDACVEMEKRDPPQYLLVAKESNARATDMSLEGIPLDAGRDLAIRNGTSQDLPKLPECAGVRFASAAAIKGAFADNSWEEFRRVFPGAFGVTELSLPGYSEDGTVALVLVSTGCGEFCGLSVYWVLKKSGDAWVKDRLVTLAVS